MLERLRDDGSPEPRLTRTALGRSRISVRRNLLGRAVLAILVIPAALSGRASARPYLPAPHQATPDVSVSPPSTATSTSTTVPLVGGSAPSAGVPVTIAPVCVGGSAPSAGVPVTIAPACGRGSGLVLPASVLPPEPITAATPAPRSSRQGAPGIGWLVWAVGVVVTGLAVAGVVGAREVWRARRELEPASGGDEPEPAESDNGEAKAERLGVWFALVIAAIAVVTALAGWRAEVAGSRGSDADRRGMVAVSELAAARDEAEAQARAEEQTLRRYNAAVEAGRVDLAALQTAGGSGDSLLSLRDSGDVLLATRLHALFPTEYAAAPAGARDALVFDVKARIKDLVSERRVDADPARWFAVANREQGHRLWLLGVAVALVVAMSLVAVGQYRLPDRRRALIVALPGIAVFIAGAGFLAAGVP